jgi:hypothetical protein
MEKKNHRQGWRLGRGIVAASTIVLALILYVASFALRRGAGVQLRLSF